MVMSERDISVRRLYKMTITQKDKTDAFRKKVHIPVLMDKASAALDVFNKNKRSTSLTIGFMVTLAGASYVVSPLNEQIGTGIALVGVGLGGILGGKTGEKLITHLTYRSASNQVIKEASENKKIGQDSITKALEHYPDVPAPLVVRKWVDIYNSPKRLKDPRIPLVRALYEDESVRIMRARKAKKPSLNEKDALRLAREEVVATIFESFLEVQRRRGNFSFITKETAKKVVSWVGGIVFILSISFLANILSHNNGARVLSGLIDDAVSVSIVYGSSLIEKVLEKFSYPVEKINRAFLGIFLNKRT